MNNVTEGPWGNNPPSDLASDLEAGCLGCAIFAASFAIVAGTIGFIVRNLWPL